MWGSEQKSQETNHTDAKPWRCQIDRHGGYLFILTLSRDVSLLLPFQVEFKSVSFIDFI